jgi:hypothetical protein
MMDEKNRISGRAVTLAAACLLCAAAKAPAQTRVVKLHLTPAAATAGFAWQKLAEDPKGDVRSPRLPDAGAVSYHYDSRQDLLWFRIDLHGGFRKDWFGVNVAVDADGNPDNGMAWWGTNKAFHFDRVVTAYVSDVGPYYQGFVGVADVDGVNRGAMNDISKDVRIALDEKAPALLVGIRRADLGTSRGELRALCTVGSTSINNDDVPNEGALTVKLAEATSRGRGRGTGKAPR